MIREWLDSYGGVQAKATKFANVLSISKSTVGRICISHPSRLGIART